MASDYKWRRPEVLTKTMRLRLERIAELARHHAKPSGPAALMGITVATLQRTLYDLTGSSSWPPTLDAALFELPVEAADDEGETADTIRARLVHWLRSTDTVLHVAAQAFRCTVPVLQDFIDGRDVPEWLPGRALVRMRGAPWGYENGRKRPMPLDSAQRGTSDRPLKDPNDLQARIDADQARRRQERERWLEIEQQKYRLPRRGRLPEDMAA